MIKQKIMGNIKMSDLRIGATFSHGRPEKCNHLTITKAVLLELLQVKSPLDNLYGIPLTEEWLERMGFTTVTKNADGSFNYWGKELDASIDIEADVTPNGVHRLFKYRLSSDRKKTLIYVHQLQNLYYSLTGEELTIKTNV